MVRLEEWIKAEHERLERFRRHWEAKMKYQRASGEQPSEDEWLLEYTRYVGLVLDDEL